MAKRKKTTFRSEREFQEWSANYLATCYPWLFALHIPNEGWRLPHEGRRLKAHGMRKGAADWLVRPMARRIVWIELKQPGNSQSAAQREFQEDVESLDDEYYVVRTAEEFAALIARLVGPMLEHHDKQDTPTKETTP